MPPPRRLGSLRNPGPLKRQRAGPSKQQASAAATKATCCDAPDPQQEDGAIICRNCFTQISDENIVSEVTFEENQGGRATVQGGTVQDNARHAKSMGSGSYRKVGGGERNTLADIQNAGRRALQQLCPKLGIENTVMVQAEHIWTLAANINFSAGRRTDEVVAACLYAACRRQKKNAILLMDIAELLKINVFRLGEVYKDMCKELYLNNENVGQQFLQELEPLIKKYCDKLQFGSQTKTVAQDALRIIRRMNRDWIVDGRHPAGLCGACIILAARMNNFQRSVREVVYVSKIADATIAKRVEEFRRTKSATLTVQEFREYANRIKHQHDPPSLYESQAKQDKMEKRRQKRAEHMRMLARDAGPSQTPIEIPDDATDTSSRLSSLDPDLAVSEEDVGERVQGLGQQMMVGPVPPPTPPMTQEQAQAARACPPPLSQQIGSPASPGNQKRKRSRLGDPDEAAREQNDSDGNTSKRQRVSNPSPGPSTPAPPPTVRYDADGFAIPALPVPTDQVNGETPARKRGRGRPPQDLPAPVVLSEEELAEENYLEDQIEAALAHSEVQESQSQVEKTKEEERAQAYVRARALADEQRKIDADKNRAQREANGRVEYWDPNAQNPNPTAEDLEKEFADDPEVAICLLDEAEVRIKEQIWVTHNEDWLRKQAEKEMLAKVAKATNPGGARKGKKGDKGGKRKKRGRMGDGTVLTETSTPIETPADAARAMLEKRAPQKSQFVDFSALQRIYGRETPSRASSTDPIASGEQSRNGTPARDGEEAGTPAPNDAQSQEGLGDAGSPSASAGAEDEDDYAEGEVTNPALLPATWLNAEDDPAEDGDDNEVNEDAGLDMYGQLRTGKGTNQDEFGAFDDEFEGEDYMSYD